MDQAGFEPAWVYTMGLNRTVLNTPDQRDFSTALAVERAFNVCSRDLSRVSRRGSRHAADPWCGLSAVIAYCYGPFLLVLPHPPDQSGATRQAFC